MRPLLCASTVIVLLLSSTGSAQSRRIVAVGDIHGALEPFVAVMQAAGLVDSARRWSGGTATFIQTGDATDRGRDVRGVLDLLMALEAQASQAGGRALTLLGNHEVMNLVGEYRDVTPDIYETFADGSSESRRERAWEQYSALAAARAKARPDAPLPEVYAQTREAWLAAHPPGWLEYREAFSPSGRYGAWLRGRRIAARVDGTLFMHAGVNPLATNPDVDAAERRVREDIARVDAIAQSLVKAGLALPFFSFTERLQVAAAEIRAANAVMAAAKEAGRPPDLGGFDVDLLRDVADFVGVGEWPILAEEGPLWYRGYAGAPEATLRDPLKRFLDRNDVTRIVVAHSPIRERRISTRLGGAVVLIDTGMLASAYKGRPSALELAGGKLTAIYTDGRVPLEVSRPSAGQARPLQE